MLAAFGLGPSTLSAWPPKLPRDHMLPMKTALNVLFDYYTTTSRPRKRGRLPNVAPEQAASPVQWHACSPRQIRTG